MRRSLALLLLVGLLVGPPALLAVVGFYDFGSLNLLVAGDIRLLLAGLTVVGWAAWAVWVALLAAELVARLTSGRLHLRLPGLAAPQLVAGALLAAALASSVPGVAQARTPERAAVAASQFAQVVVGAEREAEQPRTGPGHVVVAGDDLWTLAERYYDDGREWRRIVAANPHLEEDPTAELPAGEWLSVPDQVRLVKVKAGDTLSHLAKKHLGDADRWPEIHALNRSRVADPDMIDIGWVLKVPRPVAEAKRDPTPKTPGGVAPKTTREQPTEVTQSGGPVGERQPGEVPREVDAAPSSLAGAASAMLAQPGAESATGHVASVAPTLGPDGEPQLVGALVGGMSSLAASMVLGGVSLRRTLRDRNRPPGRRFAHVSGPLQRFESALGARQAPGRELLIDRALRHLAAHWHACGVPAPRLEQAVVGGTALEFAFGSDAPLPDGFSRLGGLSVIGLRTLQDLPDVDHPAAFPAMVTLGADAAGDLVMIDLAGAGVLGVRGRAEGLARETLSAMLIELTCAPWNDDLELVVVTDDDEFARLAGGPTVSVLPDAEAAVGGVERWASQRRIRLAGGDYDALRLDPEVADAWRPMVALFEVAPSEPLVARLESALAGAPLGVAVALPVGGAAGDATWRLSASRSGSEVALRRVQRAHGVPDDTRAAIAGLLRNASDTTTSPAPWWTGSEDDDVKIIELHPQRGGEGPRLLMLGPIELVDAAGNPPERAARACMEYCAWLLEHPGSTSIEMMTALLVADGTRRSNMSRLRAWLGDDADGDPHLPEAYSGRISLGDRVSSDWEQFRALIASGVVRTPPERLRLALELVRGAPLADAAPGQWHWAEEMRSDMTATIRDVALALARHARVERDLELARWATNRGLAAAAEDELLLGELIRIEHALGHADQVSRLVTRLTRTARVLGVDLLPETVELCQEVLEGRIRARRA